MQTTHPLTLTELEECRTSILNCLSEVQTIADCAAFELRTLKAALIHIEDLIKTFQPDGTNKRSGGSPPKKSAA